MVVIVLRPTLFRAFSAKKVLLVSPGPMAQAITFRAFGAESRVLNHPPPRGVHRFLNLPRRLSV